MSVASKPSDLIRFTDPTLVPSAEPLVKAELLIRTLVATCSIEIIHKITDELVQPYRLRVQDDEHTQNKPRKYHFYGFPASLEIDQMLDVSGIFSQAVEDALQRRFVGHLDIDRYANAFVQDLSKTVDLTWLVKRVHTIVAERKDDNNWWSPHAPRMIRFSTFTNVKTIYVFDRTSMGLDAGVAMEGVFDKSAVADVTRERDKNAAEWKIVQKERRMARALGADFIFGVVCQRSHPKPGTSVWLHLNLLGPLDVAVVNRQQTNGHYKEFFYD